MDELNRDCPVTPTKYKKGVKALSEKELKELKRRLTKLLIEARITEEEFLEKYERLIKKEESM